MIGIALPSARESRWQLDLQAFQEAAAWQKMDILVRFAGNDAKMQTLQMKELAHHGVAAIIMAPADVYHAAEGIRYAQSRGIPVISYDRLAEQCLPDAYVGFERLAVGELMGAYLAGNAPGGKYILLRGPKSDTNALDFYAGAMRFLRPGIESGRISVVLEAEVPGWRADAAERLVHEVLIDHPDVGAVLAPNDDTAGGAITALAAHGLAGKVRVTGQDATDAALQRIDSGWQGMTVFKDTRLLARKALRLAAELALKTGIASDSRVSNDSGEIPTYTLPVLFVDKQSLPWLLRRAEFP